MEERKIKRSIINTEKLKNTIGRTKTPKVLGLEEMGL